RLAQEQRQAMKRHGNLWPQVISFAALLRAAEQACKGKRFRPDILRYHFGLERELWRPVLIALTAGTAGERGPTAGPAGRVAGVDQRIAEEAFELRLGW